MSESRRESWRPLVALVVTAGLCLANLISFIVNFDHVEPWTQSLGASAVASVVAFRLLGWFGPVSGGSNRGDSSADGSADAR
ncbi:hypothetical protein GPX89_36405 [Nocardia sp. ET3-3]|uniref:Uncharacterized protein n=1 Tax=Nocardia terrae TaxID=2675851 RepID=A0A7K1V7R8_9NOCA|nr:hypothetical protein [Nocardia terrae]MVU82703.1 hypothetical protein [Nocardia terrae]